MISSKNITQKIKLNPKYDDQLNIKKKSHN